MKKIFFVIIFALLSLPISYSYGFEEKGQGCSKCHTLSKEEASDLLKGIGPNLKILEIVESPVKGMWEVDIESGDKKVPVYIDFSKKHLIFGNVIAIKEKKNLSQERFIDLNKVDISQIPLNDALFMGDKNAKYKVIVFDDPD